MIINTYAMTLNVLMIQLLSFNAHYVTKDEHLNILFYPFCSTIWILTIFSIFYATYTKKKNYTEFITLLQITSHRISFPWWTMVKSKKKILSIDTRTSKNILRDSQLLWDISYSYMWTRYNGKFRQYPAYINWSFLCFRFKFFLFFEITSY